MSQREEALAFLRENRSAHLDQLFELLRIESVSADPDRSDQMALAADWIATELRRIGVPQVEIVGTEGNPIVLGSIEPHPGSPTVLIYGHYDVQPEDPIDEWATAPFDPQVRNGALYARGASDDKGQLFMHLKAIEAYQATSELPLNIRFVFEGEEEIGSASLVDLLDAHQDRLRSELAIVSDTPMFERGIPSIGYGLRGLCYLEVRFKGPNQDLHSGQFGGAVTNPANALVGVLAGLHDKEGRVTVPGFYEDVIAVGESEREAINNLPFVEEHLRKQVGVPSLATADGHSSLERMWLEPTLDINGLKSGYQGEGAKTIIPARALAKISCRLVPDQNFERIAQQVENHIRSLAPPSVEVEVSFIHGALPWVTSPASALFDAASSAIESAFGVAPVLQRDGGSIPIVPQLARSLGVTTMLLGFGVPDENKHAPNEHLVLSNFDQGTEALIHLLAELADLETADWV